MTDAVAEPYLLQRGTVIVKRRRLRGDFECYGTQTLNVGTDVCTTFGESPWADLKPNLAWASDDGLIFHQSILHHAMFVTALRSPISSCREVALGSMKAQDHGDTRMEEGSKGHLKEVSEPAEACTLVRREVEKQLSHSRHLSAEYMSGRNSRHMEFFIKLWDMTHRDHWVDSLIL